MANKTQKENLISIEAVQPSPHSVSQDLKHSVLIVSLLVNLYIFTTWIALQVTTQYDEQLASFLFSR